MQLDAAGAHPKRTGRAHLRALAAGRGVHRNGVDEAIIAVGLDDAASRQVGSYSLGMRQRLGLASALLRRSSVYLLDEPTNGLDPHGIRWLSERLAAEAAAGAAVFISSHALGDLEQIVDEGNPIERIRHHAREADLLIVGHSKRARRSTVLSPDISLFLLHDAPVSTLFVPRARG